MSRKHDSHKSQPTLRHIASKNTSTRNASLYWVFGVGNVERLGRRLTESLHAVESEVVECEQGSVGDEDHIEITVADDYVVRLLNDFLQRTSLDS